MTTILEFHIWACPGTVPMPDDLVKAYKWMQQDHLAQMLIKINISDEQMVHINQSLITTVAQMWSSLCAIHEQHEQSALTAAKHTFYGM